MKIKISLIFTIFILHASIRAQQSCVWQSVVNGNKNQQIIKMKVLNNNHILICGAIDDTSKIDNVKYFECNLPSGFVAEFDNNRNVVFTQIFQNITDTASAGTSFVNCNDVLKDNAGNFYVALNVSGTLKLDTVQIDANNAMLIAKINASGKLLWYYFLENTVPTSAVFDNFGNVVVFSYSPYPYSIIFFKLNANNGKLKKYLMGINLYYNVKTSEAIFKDNVYYVVCSFSDSIDFSNNQKIKSVKKSSAIIKLDTSWNILTYSIITGKDGWENIIRDIKTDNSNNVFVTGRYNSKNLYINDTLRLNKTTSIERMFLVKYDDKLTFKWAKQEAPSPGSYYGLRDGYKLATDNSNNVYLLSYLHNSVTLGTDVYSSSTLLLVKYDNNGQYLLSEKIAGVSLGANYDMEYNNHHLYLTIPFTSTVNICQSNIVSSDLKDTYIVEMDKLTNVDAHYLSEIEAIKVFPNPADEKIYIHAGHTASDIAYTITDITGKETDRGIANSNGINTSHLKDGLYIVNIYFGEKNLYFKIIVQHQ